MVEFNSSTIAVYYEAVWVLALFGATALLREGLGELCVQRISRLLLACSFVNGHLIDIFISTSNGARSLGFGAAWRLWGIDKSGVVERWVVVTPLCCWLVGMPFKIVAVTAVRGGNSILGSTGTWAVGIFWITFCLSTKLVAILVDRYHGLKDSNGKIMSYRKIFQARICRLEGQGMMLEPEKYDESISYLQPVPTVSRLGVEIQWLCTDNDESVRMRLDRRTGSSDRSPNGLDVIIGRQKIFVPQTFDL